MFVSFFALLSLQGCKDPSDCKRGSGLDLRDWRSQRFALSFNEYFTWCAPLASSTPTCPVHCLFLLNLIFVCVLLRLLPLLLILVLLVFLVAFLIFLLLFPLLRFLPVPLPPSRSTPQLLILCPFLHSCINLRSCISSRCGWFTTILK